MKFKGNTITNVGYINIYIYTSEDNEDMSYECENLENNIHSYINPNLNFYVDGEEELGIYFKSPINTINAMNELENIFEYTKKYVKNSNSLLYNHSKVILEIFADDKFEDYDDWNDFIKDYQV